MLDGWDAELARRETAVTRIAASMLELEHHPGLRLLTTARLTGGTARRWADAAPVLATLWREVGLHRAAVAAAREVRDRRLRPGERELAELHRLLVAPSVEVERAAVALADRGLTGERERVAHVTLAELQQRLEQAYAQVRDLAVECATAHERGLAALVPAVERLAGARRLVAALGLPDADPAAAAVAALTARLAALEAAVSGDPLSAPDVAAARADVDSAADRLAGLLALRDGWAAGLAGLDAALAELAAARDGARQAHRAAADVVLGPLPDLPPDPLPELAARRAALARPASWGERADGLAAARHAADAAVAAHRAAGALAAGLLERRAELRGRFGGYRARAARLGVAEHAELLALDAELERLLWTRPCDLAAATRALAAHRRVLAGEVAR